MKSLVSSREISTLEKGLTASAVRHKVISNNIANVNTPGFKRSDVDFEEVLERVEQNNAMHMAVTHPKHISVTKDGSSVTVRTVNDTAMRADGNNVDVDVEMANLAKNSIYYSALAHQIGRYFTNLKSAIKEGK